MAGSRRRAGRGRGRRQQLRHQPAVAPPLDSLSGPFYHVKAVFTNVANLPANASVREGAFQVGYVSNIAANNFHATVTMAIKKSVTLPAGTTMQVRFDTPLGDDFIPWSRRPT